MVLRLPRIWTSMRRLWRDGSMGTRTVALSLLVGLLLLRVVDPDPIETMRLHAFDYYQVWSPRTATVLPVVVIDIDEKSLAEVGQWPWPRTILSDLVSKAVDAGALCVAFDVVFPC